MNLINTNTSLNIPGFADNWRSVEEVLRRHYHEPDLDAAKAFYGAIAAHRLVGQPVWPMLVGPPGSMKTELLNGLELVPKVHFIDQVTANTFISGHIVEEGTEAAPAGFLHRVGNDGIIGYRDFSTVLGMKAEAKASILADMRRIYDGELRKEYGTSNNMEQRKWKGRVTFVVAATPDIDAQYSIFQSLGERFVMIRWGRPEGIPVALAAMKQDSAAARKELQLAVAALFAGLGTIEPSLSQEMQTSVAALADFVTRARTHVARNGYTKEMLYEPIPEAPTRLSQQLCQLAKGIALVGGKMQVDDEDYALVRRVALDCIPNTRRKALEALMLGQTPNLPSSSARYLFEDLEAVGLLEKRVLSAQALELAQIAKLTTSPPQVM